MRTSIIKGLVIVVAVVALGGLSIAPIMGAMDTSATPPGPNENQAQTTAAADFQNAYADAFDEAKSSTSDALAAAGEEEESGGSCG